MISALFSFLANSLVDFRTATCSIVIDSVTIANTTIHLECDGMFLVQWVSESLPTNVFEIIIGECWSALKSRLYVC